MANKTYTKPTAKTTGKDMSNQMYVSTPTEYTDKGTGELKTQWTTVGRAFKSDKGITVMLNALPVSGKLFLADATEQ